MGKVLNSNFKMNKKSRYTIITVILCFFIVSTSVYSILYSEVKDFAMKETESSVVNISRLSANTVNRALLNRKILLESFAGVLPPKEKRDYALISKKLSIYVKNYDFYNMGIIMPDGTLYKTSGETMNIAGKGYPYDEALKGEVLISEGYTTNDDARRSVNLISVPVYENGEIQFYFTAVCYSSYIEEILNADTLEGKGYNYLINMGGSTVIRSDSYENDEIYSELMEFINRNPQIYPGKKSNITFEFKGETFFAHFEKIEVNDWYVMTCCREKDVYAGADDIARRVFIGMIFLWLQLCATILFIIYLYLKFQKNTKEAIYKDTLIGSKNSNYLKAYYPMIPAEEKSDMAFVALDIDKFKEFNFIYGTEAGDHLLIYINDIFCELFPDDHIYRYSADMFGALMKGKLMSEVRRKLDLLLKHFSTDIESGVINPFDVSMGIRLFRGDEPLSVVYSDALIAKNTVKGNRMQPYAFYNDEMRRDRIKQMEMESEFGHALKNGEFHVYYQPKYNMESNKIIGAEALVRWIKSDGSVIPPGAFVPCFEASRQIVLLDELMLKNVCLQMKKMQEAGIKVKPVSVNLSRIHLKYPGITEKIRKIFLDTGVNPSCISFEITESALYEDSIPLRDIIDGLHDMGCNVDMDDYGTGMSGPSALAKNEFDVLKLDKSFIDGIGNRKMESVICSTIRMAADLGMNIIAEGVEKKEQAETLVSWGCSIAQGYYYSRPVPEDVYWKMLEQSESN